jgi:hypothetical protein
LTALLISYIKTVLDNIKILVDRDVAVQRLYISIIVATKLIVVVATSIIKLLKNIFKGI